MIGKLEIDDEGSLSRSIQLEPIGDITMDQIGDLSQGQFSLCQQQQDQPDFQKRILGEHYGLSEVVGRRVPASVKTNLIVYDIARSAFDLLIDPRHVDAQDANGKRIAPPRNRTAAMMAVHPGMLLPISFI